MSQHPNMPLNLVLIMACRFLPTKMNRRMMEIDRQIQASLIAIISKRENATKVEGGAINDDLLGILMESNSKEIQENENN